MSHSCRQRLSEEVQGVQKTQMELMGIKASPRHGRTNGGRGSCCPWLVFLVLNFKMNVSILLPLKQLDLLCVIDAFLSFEINKTSKRL